MEKKIAAVVPHPEEFRPWVQDALAVLGISAASVSRALGLGRNTLADFLNKPGRSIDMKNAAAVTAYLRAEAAGKGVVLGQIEVGAHV